MMLYKLKRLIKKIFILTGLYKDLPSKSKRDEFIGAKIIGEAPLIKVGDNVSFGGDVLLYANSEIEIGENTIIAYHVIIHTSTHDPEDNPIWSRRIDRPIRIGKNVWIGTGSIILPGVIIGDNSIIGAGSIVNANVPEGVIVCGSPARIIRSRDKSIYSSSTAIKEFDQSRIEKRGFLTEECKHK